MGFTERPVCRCVCLLDDGNNTISAHKNIDLGRFPLARCCWSAAQTSGGLQVPPVGSSNPREPEDGRSAQHERVVGVNESEEFQEMRGDKSVAATSSRHP